MKDEIESGKYPGGTIMEISKLGTRVIPEWNIFPPGGELKDGEMAAGTDTPADAIQRALGPIFDVTAKERGALVTNGK